MGTNFLKNEALAYVAAATLAFGLFEGFDSFMTFCQWLQPLIYAWRFLVYNLFDLLFFWLPFEIPRAIIDIVVVMLLAATVLFRALSMWTRRQNLNEAPGTIVLQNQNVFLKLYPFCVFIVGGFILLPVFGWTPQLLPEVVNFTTKLQSVMYAFPLMLRFAVFAFLSSLAFFVRAKLEQGLFIEAAISRQLVRVVTMLALLLTLNFIGLYADTIRSIDMGQVTQDVHGQGR